MCCPHSGQANLKTLICWELVKAEPRVFCSAPSVAHWPAARTQRNPMLSPVESKPATQGRIKTSHPEASCLKHNWSSSDKRKPTGGTLDSQPPPFIMVRLSRRIRLCRDATGAPATVQIPQAWAVVNRRPSRLPAPCGLGGKAVNPRGFGGRVPQDRGGRRGNFHAGWSWVLGSWGL